MTRYTYVLAAILLAGVTSCNRTGDANPKDSSTAAATAPVEREIVIPVEAELPSRGSISAHFETTSRILAENRVEVTTKTSGTCVELHAEAGETVQEGAVLAVLTQPEILQALSAAEIIVPHRKVEYERALKGLSLGLNSQAELDAARASYEQAKSTVEQQRVQVDNLTIKAPISGVITARNILVGQLIPAGHSAFSMVDPQSYILMITPPEQELPRLRPGQVAQVNIDALGGKEYEARVRRINPAVDSVTGTVDVVLDFDAETRGQLMDAAFARVRLVMETHDDALLVPKDSIVEENARKYLFLVRKPEAASTPAADAAAAADAPPAAETPGAAAPAAVSDTTSLASVAERVEVRAGLEDKDHVEILSGLTDQDLVVTVGQHNLKSGSKVDVMNIEDALMARMDLNADDALKEARAKREAEEQEQQQEQQRHRRRRMH
jgi:membrane fusion protein (multidrug efflux system)